MPPLPNLPPKFAYDSLSESRPLGAIVIVGSQYNPDSRIPGNAKRYCLRRPYNAR